MISQDRLKELLDYDAETGVFTRKSRAWRVREDGQAGTIDNGRRKICLDGVIYKAHRLAWLWVHGEWPANDVDHINGNPLDNSIANLRVVSRAVNMQNMRRARANNKSGFLGVTTSPSGSYVANIKLQDGTRLKLGTYKTPEEAHAAYVKTKRLVHQGCSI